MKAITLLTDFGTTDYFVGAMKGAILSVNPEARIFDITHEAPPHNIRSAAFTLLAAHSTYPKGSIHVAIVDPGVGSARRPILAVGENYFFIAPDNGILSWIYENESEISVFHITNNRFFRQPVSNTFHGRDVFAPVAGALSRGVLPAELGEEITDFVRFETSKPLKIDENTIRAEIIHIDHFGNCVTNLTQNDLLPNFREFSIEINEREISRLQNFYAEATQKGEIFTIFGSAGFLEIVAFQDSAARLLKAGIAQTLTVKKK